MNIVIYLIASTEIIFLKSSLIFYKSPQTNLKVSFITTSYFDVQKVRLIEYLASDGSYNCGINIYFFDN